LSVLLLFVLLLFCSFVLLFFYLFFYWFVLLLVCSFVVLFLFFVVLFISYFVISFSVSTYESLAAAIRFLALLIPDPPPLPADMLLLSLFNGVWSLSAFDLSLPLSFSFSFSLGFSRSFSLAGYLLRIKVYIITKKSGASRGDERT
jgi:hypothetical protein